MSETQPFFSVVVPTFRRPAQLAACLEALARQQFARESYEVVVVDDGSGEPPAEVIEQFRTRLDVKLLTPPHAGPSAARNAGARRARGRFLAFTDDDCEPEAGWLQGFAARLSVTPDRLVGGCTVNALPRNPHAATSHAIIEVVYAHYNARPDDALFFASNNIAMSAELFAAVGGFDESFRTSEDRDLCDRWLGRGLRMTYAPEAVVRHAHHLTLVSLWRQHYGYGRGALRFYRARRSRGAEPFKPDPRFYLKLLTHPASQRRGLLLTALVLWSQAANSFGFLREWAGDS